MQGWFSPTPQKVAFLDKPVYKIFFERKESKKSQEIGNFLLLFVAPYLRFAGPSSLGVRGGGGSQRQLNFKSPFPPLSFPRLPAPRDPPVFALKGKEEEDTGECVEKTELSNIMPSSFRTKKKFFLWMRKCRWTLAAIFPPKTGHGLSQQKVPGIHLFVRNLQYIRGHLYGIASNFFHSN